MTCSLEQTDAFSMTDICPTDSPEPAAMPPLSRQVWNLTQALADFVVDGCRTVSPEEYRQRLEICDTCNRRRGGRCLVCGCRLSLKARGRAFRCPLHKWPGQAKRPDGPAEEVKEA